MRIPWESINYPATWIAIPKGKRGVVEYTEQGSRSLTVEYTPKVSVNFNGINHNSTIDLPCSIRYVGEDPPIAYDIDLPNQALKPNQRLILLKRLGFDLPTHGTLRDTKDLFELTNSPHLFKVAGSMLYISSQNAYTEVYASTNPIRAVVDDIFG